MLIFPLFSGKDGIFFYEKFVFQNNNNLYYIQNTEEIDSPDMTVTDKGINFIELCWSLKDDNNNTKNKRYEFELSFKKIKKYKILTKSELDLSENESKDNNNNDNEEWVDIHKELNNIYKYKINGLSINTSYIFRIRTRNILLTKLYKNSFEKENLWSNYNYINVYTNDGIFESNILNFKNQINLNNHILKKLNKIWIKYKLLLSYTSKSLYVFSLIRIVSAQ